MPIPEEPIIFGRTPAMRRLQINYARSIFKEVIALGLEEERLVTIFQIGLSTVRNWAENEPRMYRSATRAIAYRLGSLLDFMQDDLKLEPEQRQEFISKTGSYVTHIAEEAPGLPRIERQLELAFPAEYESYLRQLENSYIQ